MKNLFFFPLFVFLVAKGSAQTQTHLQVVNGAVKVSNGELVLGNQTAAVNGYLYNSGGGTTLFTDAQTSRSYLGIEAMRLISSWANTSAINTDKFLLNNVAGGSSPVTYTLPAANSVNAGAVITIGDAFGSPGAGIQIAPAGSDHLNGATTATAPFTTPFFQVYLVSDKNGNWHYYVPSQGGGGGTSVPASATQAGIISLGSQTLGTGVKTVQELTSQNNINLPATVGSGTGVITMGGSPFAHAFGVWNTFVGPGAGSLSLNVSASFGGTGVGYQALSSLTTGSQNSALGYRAGFQVTSGYQSTFLGYNAGSANSTGYDNTFVGFGAGGSNIDGNNNIFIGWAAGGNSVGGSNPSSNNIMIGNRTGTQYTYDGSNNVLIGNSALATAQTVPSNKLCVTGGFDPVYLVPLNLIYGDFNTGQVKINATSWDPQLTPSAALEVVSANKGFLQPVVSPYSIANPAEGLSIYDPGSHSPKYFNGTSWSTISLPHRLFTNMAGYATFNLLDNGNNILTFYGGGTLNNIILALPTAPGDGDIVMLTFKLPATYVTYTGGTVNNPITNFAVNQQVILQYDQATSSWY